MIKENILNFTAVLSIFVLTGSSADAIDVPLKSTNLKTVYVEKIVYPESPERRTQLDELDKIILEYEGQRKVQEVKVRLEVEKQRTIELSEWAQANTFVARQAKIDDLVEELIGYAGVTPYGFGATPEVWDCSGLTKWYLAQQDIEVIHSATAQVATGTRAQNPIAGDLVAFQKEGSSDYFHIGVYVGGGLMIHSSNPEKGTNLQSIYEFATVEDSTIAYVRY